MTEDQFFDTLFCRLPPPSAEIVVPPGDDCAAICIDDTWLQLLATDQLVGNRHYELTGSNPATPELAGRKLLARNLSDIAAMGGIPQYCLVSTTVTPQAGPQWVQRFLEGIIILAEEFGVQMIGGDLAAAPNDLVGSLTIVGRVEKSYVCRRTGAAPGDLLFATGAFGDSLASGHHLTFTPRCAEGRWLACTGRVKAMIDVSDGLLIDAWRMCKASHTALNLDQDRILQRTPGAGADQALTAGEDYELLVALAPDDAEAIGAEWPFADTPWRQIGVFCSGPDGAIQGRNGENLSASGKLGYDHLDIK